MTTGWLHCDFFASATIVIGTGPGEAISAGGAGGRSALLSHGEGGVPSLDGIILAFVGGNPVLCC